MQRLTYTNLHGEKLDLWKVRPYILRSVKGTGKADADFAASRGAWQAGSTVRRIQPRERYVQAQFSIFAASPREMYEQRQKVSRILAAQSAYNPDTGQKARIVYQNDYGRWQASCVPSALTLDATRVSTALPGLSVTFRCDSPFWSSVESYFVEMRRGDGGLRLPFRLPIRLGSSAFSALADVGGSANAPVVITIRGSGEAPAIINRTTGAQISLARQLASGETLIIDTNPDALRVVIQHADGTQENAFSFLESAGAVSDFYLAPGVNRVDYVPDEVTASSYASVSWKTLFEGV
jgi:hypothetical protein